MRRYIPKEIEPKWQQQWADSKLYEVTEKPGVSKRYVTAMFPYPSGAGLHVGHVRNYSITDAIARFQRQNGQNTLSTIGWDGFGLPAENYAIKTGTPPAVSTAQNIQNFKGQLQRLGMSYDWSRELNTTDPSYYKWTQWLFLQFFKQGLAYQKESLQWWCPHDKTVLANEQVEAGRCWRCGHEVIKKSMKQWFFKITDYADALLEGIDDLDWPEKIKTMQRNWIGKSKGAEVSFAIDGLSDKITVFTTRVDTLYGVTFLVLAPEHPLLEQVTIPERSAAVQAYKNTAVKKSEIQRQENKEKTGEFTGSYAINPVTGQKLPIWTADYVLMGYGTGAIMAVPGHDERDLEFAQTFELPIEYVVAPTFGDPHPDAVQKQSVVIALKDPKTNQFVVLNWGPRQSDHGGNMLIGGTREADEDAETTALREIAEETGYTNVRLIARSPIPGYGNFYSDPKAIHVAMEATGLYYELIDDSRIAEHLDEGEQNKFSVEWQPFEKVVNLLDDGIHAYYFRSLVLGETMHDEGILINSGDYTGMATSDAREKIVLDLEAQGVASEQTNYKMRDWLISRQRYWGTPIPIIHCPTDGAVAVPEADLPVILPEIKNYEPDGSGKSALAKATDWVNVSCPTCGGAALRETDTMDGYVCSSWYLFRYADAHNETAAWDPAKVNYWAPVDFYCGGDHAVAHLLYVRFWTHVFAKMGLVDFTEPIKRLVYNGYIYASDGTKMSKSKGNVVDPLEVVDSGYGADSLRTYELFCGPYEQDTTWDPGGVAGTYRFINRTWTLVQEFSDSTTEEAPDAQEQTLYRAAHKAIKKVSKDLEGLSFNTAVAAQMELVNELYKIKEIDHFANRSAWQFTLVSLLQLLAPFAPHVTEELWQQLGNEGSVHTAMWPAYDEQYLVEDTVTIAIQVNGKLRATISAPSDSNQETISELAWADTKVAGYLAGTDVLKTIYVPNKLLSLVVK
jgi:leucyl-tRNA synthetase